MMETNRVDMGYFNFTFPCQLFDVFVSYQWNVRLSGVVFLVARVDKTLATLCTRKNIKYLNIV